MISPSSYHKVQPIVDTCSTKTVRFKGVKDPVELYDITGLDGKYQIALPEKKMLPLTHLESPLAFMCYPLEGKAVSEDGIPGQITKLGEAGAEVSLTRPVAAHTSLKIVLGSEKTKFPGELYARATPAEGVNAEKRSGATQLQFTWVPEEVKQYFAAKIGLELS